VAEPECRDVIRRWHGRAVHISSPINFASRRGARQ
jgi:hypothetical protein